MIALDRIRRQGFDIRQTEAGIYIDPIFNLKSEQRLRAASNRKAVCLNKLTTRWQWFLSLAAEYGIHPSVVGAEFPGVDDRLSVVGLQVRDSALRMRMDRICTHDRVIQRQREYEASRWASFSADGS